MLWRLYQFLGTVFPTFFAAGQITIQQSGEFEISLPFTPANVWLDAESANGIGVCNGSQDGFDWKPIPNGLVILATLNSESRTIQWVASR